MPRISVVVPIFDVESYLEPCLESLAGQTLRDLEVILVDDGSTDRSARIAEAFAARDRRFRLIRQPNSGLGSARNTGTSAAGGEFLAFLDSDDVLPANAYELLLGALERSGSDFASGNVHRLTAGVQEQALFLQRTFAQPRLATHVTKQRSLLADRTAWNKLWRRSFWEAHAMRFPEGVVHEDIPVTLPAHFRARQVDVVAAPVYLWRIREGGALSITQRRREPQVLLDRLAAIDQVRTYIAAHGPRKALRWYEESVVADDLKLHLNVLDGADDGYRALFMQRAGAFLEETGVDLDRLPLAIDRLKWELVRRGRLDDVLEVLRFQAERQATTRPVRVRGGWHGDYPLRGDRRLPRAAFRLGRRDPELAVTATLERVERDGDRLRLSGRACIAGLGAPSHDSQHVELGALPAGRWRSLRMRTSAVRLRTYASRRDGDWTGFEAALPIADLGTGDGSWELFTYVRCGGVRRRWARFALADRALAGAVDLSDEGDVRIKAIVSEAGKVTIRARERWAALTGVRRDGEALELSGALRRAGTAPLLEVGGLAVPLDVRAGAFRARVPLGVAGPLVIAGMRVDLPPALAGTAWRLDGTDVTLARNPAGEAELRAQPAAAKAPAALPAEPIASVQAVRT